MRDLLREEGGWAGGNPLIIRMRNRSVAIRTK